MCGESSSQFQVSAFTRQGLGCDEFLGSVYQDTCQNDRRLFHIRIVKGCSILSLRRHSGQNYCSRRFEISSKCNTREDTRRNHKFPTAIR
ncbi:hypothetical protein CLF_107335 [Clonorchis sinensis]|uniref:Uncharacterized protein n=1 Tax=Clonorchis sinensis TaxID=79923 RepID=G7YGL7_CLOSI|nr:hypothetical protein CLF_107335 [Clonorchis sinensis]